MSDTLSLSPAQNRSASEMLGSHTTLLMFLLLPVAHSNAETLAVLQCASSNSFIPCSKSASSLNVSDVSDILAREPTGSCAHAWPAVHNTLHCARTCTPRCELSPVNPAPCCSALPTRAPRPLRSPALAAPPAVENRRARPGVRAGEGRTCARSGTKSRSVAGYDDDRACSSSLVGPESEWSPLPFALRPGLPGHAHA